MSRETKKPGDPPNRLHKTIPVRFQVVAGALVCVLFGALLGWGVHALWQMEDIPVTSTLKEQMMHRKTRRWSRFSTVWFEETCAALRSPPST